MVWVALCQFDFFPAFVPDQNFSPESTLRFALPLHFADASSNMYFGRWKKLMIKGTLSDFHLNYNPSLIFPLFISHFLYSGSAASLFAPLPFHLHLFFFLPFTPISSIFGFVLHFSSVFIFHLIVWSCLVLSFWLYSWKLKAIAAVRGECACMSRPIVHDLSQILNLNRWIIPTRFHALFPNSWFPFHTKGILP